MSAIKNFTSGECPIGGLAALVVGIALLSFPLSVLAQYEDYEGPEYCKQCHEENYNEWKSSGHPYKLMKGEEARFRDLPLPEGFDWDDISYVIGGYKWKSRYIGQDGFIITSTGEDKDIPGNNQWNKIVGFWSDYHPGEEKPYDCGTCHTTGWIADEDWDTDDDLTDNQDGMPGMRGTFFAGGVQCEQCHGPGFDSMEVDDSAEFCGGCHFRGSKDPAALEIPASGGWIRHHEQYNEFLASPMDMLKCVSCHDPHKRAEFSITTTCETCHEDEAAAFAMNEMSEYGVECIDCHMPYATKSAQPTGEHKGDVRTHIFAINTDPDAAMFTEDGGLVALDENMKAKVTMDFACQRCHLTADLDELARFAEGFHDRAPGSLEGLGLDPGLTGAWWDASRSGEGFVLQVGYTPDTGELFLFASFYTYDDQGNQVWLVAQSTSIDGNTANVDVYVTSGRMWGDSFDPNDGSTDLWGTGTFTFPTCSGGSFMLMPNADAQAAGFTDLGYDLTREDFLMSGIACPTFMEDEEGEEAVAAR